MRGRRGGPLVHRPRAARRRSTAFNARAPPVPRCRHQPPSRSHQPASPPGHSPLLHRRLLSSQASQPHLTDARGPCFSCPTGHRDRLQALAVAAECAPGFNSRQYPSTLAAAALRAVVTSPPPRPSLCCPPLHRARSLTHASTSTAPPPVLLPLPPIGGARGARAEREQAPAVRRLGSGMAAAAAWVPR
jgi:hypothetical protein